MAVARRAQLFFAKIDAMFHSDAILVDLADLFAQRIIADQQLRAAMAARSRPGYALRTLLADEQARGTAVEAVRVLAATSGPVPLVLTMPAPGRWLVAAAQQAQRDGPDPGPPDAGQAETAAMYNADFLRIFAGTGIDALLPDEGRVPARELIHPEAYSPQLYVGHYGGGCWGGPMPPRPAARSVPDVAVWLAWTRRPGQTSHPVAGAWWQARTSGTAQPRRRRPALCSPSSRPRLSPKPS